VALLAAIALDRAITRLGEYGVRAPRWSAASGWLAAIVVFVPIAVHHRDVLVDKWDEPPVPSGRVQESFFLSFLPHYLQRRAFPPGASLPENNHGTGHCYTGMDYFPAIGLWAGPSAQVRISEPGRLEGWGRTTRTVWADVDLPVGGHVVFNQTQAPGWRSEFGPPQRDDDRASVDVPPGQRRVLLRYEPPSLPWAFGASLAGLALAFSMASRRATDFLTGSPRRMLGFGLAFAGFGLLAYLRGVFAPEPTARVAQISRLTATASGTSESELHTHYSPDKAVDGDPKTEWLAPDFQEAWLDVRLEPAVPMKAVALLNARNPPFDDRGAQQFRVEAYLGPRRVAIAEDSFGPKSDQQTWRYVPIQADSADRIRVIVQTWSGLGGGIAEVRVF